MKILKSLSSNDKKTTKFLQSTKEGSQIGCLMGCIFCATTDPVGQSDPNKPFIRNLTSAEIVSQVCNVSSLIVQSDLKSKRILFSYMGMGEPFLNYKNVFKSIKSLSKKFPNSRTTISTLGVRPDLMRKMAHLKLNNVLKLHLSLHAPNDELRRKILPKAQKIQPTLQALKYFSLIRKVPAKVNYILIKGLNDSKNHAHQLVRLLQPYLFTVKLSNLNKFNNLLPSSIDKFDIFEEILNSKGIKTCRFFSTGVDIEAGCGQLRKRYCETIK